MAGNEVEHSREPSDSTSFCSFGMEEDAGEDCVRGRALHLEAEEVGGKLEVDLEERLAASDEEGIWSPSKKLLDPQEELVVYERGLHGLSCSLLPVRA